MFFPDAEIETSADVARFNQLNPAPFSDYLSAKVSQGFEMTTLYAMGKTWLEKTADADAYLSPEDYASVYGDAYSGVTAVDPLAAKVRMRAEERGEWLTPDDWRNSEFYREGIDIPEEGMTKLRAKTWAEDYDRRRERDEIIRKAEPGVFGSVVGFGAAMVGAVPDPINFVPILDVGKATSVAGAVARGAVEGAVATAAADAVVLPEMARRGEDLGFVDAVYDIAIGGALGGLFAGGAKGIQDRIKARKEITQAAKREGLEVFEKAVDDVLADGAADVGAAITARKKLFESIDNDAADYSPPKREDPVADVGEEEDVLAALPEEVRREIEEAVAPMERLSEKLPEIFDCVIKA